MSSVSELGAAAAAGGASATVTGAGGASGSGSGSAALWGSRSVRQFQKLLQVGEGTYGKVYKARDKETNEFVALKRVRMDNEKEGFPITAIREIKILKRLSHPNVVKLKEIVTADDDDDEADDLREGGGIYMVFEFMDHDLTGLSESNQYGGGFPLRQIKCYMLQLLEGLFYIHHNNILHRDLKCSNLLVNNKGELKIADFGLARPFNTKIGVYTNCVITLWYRPPELLLGEDHYGPAIDMWSAGCILAEMLRRRPLFPGRNELDQLLTIFAICGTPTDATWSGVEKLPKYSNVRAKPVPTSSLASLFGEQTRDTVDLVLGLLRLNPAERLTAKQALDMDWFWSEPLPAKPSDLPRYHSSHEFTTKKRKNHAAASAAAASSAAANTAKQRAVGDAQARLQRR